MKIIKTGMLLGLITIFSLGCSKDPLNNMTAEESRIYITDHDSTVNFSNYKTFTISDSVAVIRNGNETKQLNPVDSSYIQAVRDAMQSRGYIYVDKSQNPDLGITVNHIISTSTGVVSYDTYWDDYSMFWDPYYWGYPGYGYYLPYAYSVYQITEGAVSVDMVDLKNANTNKKLNVIWTGLIRGSGIYNTQVAQSQVAALFNQSAYLNVNL